MRRKTTEAERIKLLSAFDVLEPLSIEAIRKLAQRVPERIYQSSEGVYAPGDASESVYLLLEGRVRLYGMVGAEELTFEVIHSGEMFGVASLMEHTHDEYAQTLEPSWVGLLYLNAFWDLLRQEPEVSARVMRLLGNRLRRSRGRMLDIALKEVSARLANLILHLCKSEGVTTREGYYKIVTHYTHAQLATMIGAKRVAVTRAFGTLQDNRWVRLQSRQIYVIDLEALKLQAAGD